MKFVGIRKNTKKTDGFYNFNDVKINIEKPKLLLNPKNDLDLVKT